MPFLGVAGVEAHEGGDARGSPAIAGLEDDFTALRVDGAALCVRGGADEDVAHEVGTFHQLMPHSAWGGVVCLGPDKEDQVVGVDDGLH